MLWIVELELKPKCIHKRLIGHLAATREELSTSLLDFEFDSMRGEYVEAIL